MAQILKISDKMSAVSISKKPSQNKKMNQNIFILNCFFLKTQANTILACNSVDGCFKDENH